MAYEIRQQTTRPPAQPVVVSKHRSKRAALRAYQELLPGDRAEARVFDGEQDITPEAAS